MQNRLVLHSPAREHSLTLASIGADSRTTTGAYIANRVTDKLTRVHDTIWCCRSGSAADTQAVAYIVQYQLGMFAMRNGKTPTTQTAAAIFQELCYSNKDQLRYVLYDGHVGSVERDLDWGSSFFRFRRTMTSY
jgi:20S proteasome alpha/beta subunit